MTIKEGRHSETNALLNALIRNRGVLPSPVADLDLMEPLHHAIGAENGSPPTPRSLQLKQWGHALIDYVLYLGAENWLAKSHFPPFGLTHTFTQVQPDRLTWPSPPLDAQPLFKFGSGPFGRRVQATAWSQTMAATNFATLLDLTRPETLSTVQTYVSLNTMFTTATAGASQIRNSPQLTDVLRLDDESLAYYATLQHIDGFRVLGLTMPYIRCIRPVVERDAPDFGLRLSDDREERALQFGEVARMTTLFGRSFQFSRNTIGASMLQSLLHPYKEEVDLDLLELKRDRFTGTYFVGLRGDISISQLPAMDGKVRGTVRSLQGRFKADGDLHQRCPYGQRVDLNDPASEIQRDYWNIGISIAERSALYGARDELSRPLDEFLVPTGPMAVSEVLHGRISTLER